MSIVLGLIGLLGQTADAAPVQVGGYMRVMTRPDVQGGNGTLGYWNLYGRLLNERGYTMLDTRVQFKKPILLAILGAVFTFGQKVVPSPIQTLETVTFPTFDCHRSTC